MRVLGVKYILFCAFCTRPNTRGYERKKWVASQTDKVRNGLYEFTGCVSIKRLSLLDISTVISCLTVTSRPLNFEKRKWAVFDEWLFVCNYSVVFDGWTTTVDIRKAEQNRALRLTTVGIWPWICLVMPGSRITTWHFVYVRRKTTNDEEWVFVSAPLLFVQDGCEG